MAKSIIIIIFVSLYFALNDGHCCKKRPTSSVDCVAKKDPNTCGKDAGCIWDCDGQLLAHLGTDKIFGKIDFVTVSEKSTKKAKRAKNGKPKRKFENKRWKLGDASTPDIDYDERENDYAEIHKSAVLRVDGRGVVYRCHINPLYPGFFKDKDEVKKEKEVYESVKVKVKAEKKVVKAKEEAKKSKTTINVGFWRKFFDTHMPKIFQHVYAQVAVRARRLIGRETNEIWPSRRRLPAVADWDANDHETWPSRRRLPAVADWDAAGWVNRPNGNAPWNSVGALEFEADAVATPEDFNGVGTVISSSTVNGQRYDWVVTAGHNCWDSNRTIPIGERRSRHMKMALGYHSLPGVGGVNPLGVDPFAAAPVLHTHGHGVAAIYPLALGAADTTLYIHEYRTYSSPDENEGLEYRYDYCVIQFPVAAYAAAHVPVQYDSRWSVGGAHRKRLFMATYYVTHNDFNFRQVYFRQNTVARKNKMNFKTRQSFLFSPFEFTEQGTSGSPWFVAGINPGVAYNAANDVANPVNIIGLHVGARDLGTGDDYEIVNRFTKPQYLLIVGYTGSGGTGTADSQNHGVSTAHNIGYDDLLNENYYDSNDDDQSAEMHQMNREYVKYPQMNNSNLLLMSVVLMVFFMVLLACMCGIGGVCVGGVTVFSMFNAKKIFQKTQSPQILSDSDQQLNV